MSGRTDPGPGDALRSVGRAFSALELLVEAAPRPVRVVDVAARLEVDPATASRLLATLTSRGYASRTPQRRYTVGPRSLRMAHGWVERLRGASAGPMERMSRTTGEAVMLTQLLGTQAVPIATRLPPGQHLGSLPTFDAGIPHAAIPDVAYPDVAVTDTDAPDGDARDRSSGVGGGTSGGGAPSARAGGAGGAAAAAGAYPAWATAAGRALLAALPPEERRRALPPEPYPRFTARTPTSWPDLRDVIRTGLRDRLHFEQGEAVAGLWCYALPLPRGANGEILSLSVLATGDLCAARHARILRALRAESRTLGDTIASGVGR
jgi:DNA-binding IclR family transcriptional regulator